MERFQPELNVITKQLHDYLPSPELTWFERDLVPARRESREKDP